MKIERFQADDCLKYQDDIALLLQEIYLINLPNSNLSVEQSMQMAQDLIAYLNEGKAMLLGVFENKEFAGFLWAYPRMVGNEKRVHLNHIILKDAYRGKGIGNELLKKLEECAFNEGYEGIELLSSVSNNGAMRFYEANGFAVERVQFFKKVAH